MNFSSVAKKVIMNYYFLVPMCNFNKGFVVNHCNDFRGSKYEVQKFHFSSKNCSWEKSLKGRVFSFSKSNMKVCFVCVWVPWWIYIQTKKLVGVKSKLMRLSNNSWRVFWANRPTPVWKLTVSKFTIFTPKSNKDEWKGNVNGFPYL